MAIPKTSKIAILSGIEIDNTYQHSYWFASKSAQDNYFDNLSNNANYSVYKGNQFAFIRPDTNTVRVAVKYNKAKTGNYLFFENYTTPAQQIEFAPFKRYYAFIDDVRYIDDNLVEIDYTIDVVQTYLFDFEFANCFVEREHTISDNWGEHTIPEGLATGDAHIYENKVCNLNDPLATEGVLKLRYSNDQTIPWGEAKYNRIGVLQINFVGDKVVEAGSINFQTSQASVEAGAFYSLDWGFNHINSQGVPYNSFVGYVFGGGYSNNQYVGMKIIEMDIPEFTENAVGENSSTITASQLREGYYNGITQIINDIVQDRGSDIISIFIKPTGMDGFRGWKIPSYSATRNLSFRFFDGSEYTPKNNKMYCYPYDYVQISDTDGRNKTYKWEYHRDGLIMPFVCNYTSNPEPLVSIRPSKVLNENINNFDVGMFINPTVPIIYTLDSYLQWKATHENAVVMRGLFGTLTGAISHNPATVITSVGNVITQYTEAYNKPDNLEGSTSTKNFLRAVKSDGYTIQNLKITGEYARIIDNYFTMYGYKVNAVKMPSIHNRRGWTHLKTNNCIVHRKNSVEGYSTNVETNLCAIFDNGITFWNIADGYNVGDYDKENSLI